MLTLNNESFRNFPQFSKFLQKLIFQNLGKNENIGEHFVIPICNSSTNIFRDREVAQGGSEILPKV